KTGKTFDEDGEDLRALSTLRTWRNMLTHYKGEYEDVQQAGRGGETKIEALLSADHAAKAVEIARNLYRAFYAFDRRSAPRQFLWLDDRQHRAPSIPGPPAPTRSPTAVRSSPARSSRPGGPPRGAAGAAAAVSGTPGIRPDGSPAGGAAPDRGSAPGAHAAAADGPHPPFGGSKPEKGQRQAEVAAGPQGALPAAPGGARPRSPIRSSPSPSTSAWPARPSPGSAGATASRCWSAGRGCTSARSSMGSRFRRPRPTGACARRWRRKSAPAAPAPSTGASFRSTPKRRAVSIPTTCGGSFGRSRCRRGPGRRSRCSGGPQPGQATNARRPRPLPTFRWRTGPRGPSR